MGGAGIAAFAAGFGSPLASAAFRVPAFEGVAGAGIRKVGAIIARRGMFAAGEDCAPAAQTPAP